MNLILHLPLLILIFVFSAFFSASETALFSLSKIERRRLQERHPHMAKWAVAHLEHPRRTLLTILIGNLAVNTLGACLVTLIAYDYGGAHGISLALAVFTLLLILVAEIPPKILAVRKNEAVSLGIAVPLRVATLVVYPFRRVTRMITDWILSFLVPEKKEHPDIVSAEELKALVKIGEEEGMLDRQERYMLQKLFELGERPVKAIMTPRIDVVALDLHASREGHIASMQKFHFAHFPVYRDTIDHIVGVVSV